MVPTLSKIGYFMLTFWEDITYGLRIMSDPEASETSKETMRDNWMWDDLAVKTRRLLHCELAEWEATEAWEQKVGFEYFLDWWLESKDHDKYKELLVHLPKEAHCHPFLYPGFSSAPLNWPSFLLAKHSASLPGHLYPSTCDLTVVSN